VLDISAHSMDGIATDRAKNSDERTSQRQRPQIFFAKTHDRTFFAIIL